MKRICTTLALAILLFAGGNSLNAQEVYEALNMKIDIGSIFGINVNYEFDIADQITVAPVALIDFDGDFGIGARGAYYFDEIFSLTEPWDTYAGLELGYRFTNNGDFALGIFIGGEWHINDQWGLLLEITGGSNLSSGIAVGAAIHF